jgi:Transposase DDE domain
MSARSSSRLYAEQLDLATPRQWQDLVPRALLQQVAEEHGGDQADGKLTAPVHFWLLLVGVLSKGCSSLKDLISRCQARFGKRLGWLEGDKPWVTPAALSQRNRDRPVPFWQTLYQRLRQHHFGAGWLRKAWQKKVGVIEAIDSSTFALVARLRNVFTPTGSGGARKGSRNPKGALKVHQVYNVGEEVPAAVGIGPAREHDAKGWRRALAGARRGVLYLIDRGYCSFPLWRAIDAAWSYFITPLKVGLIYEHVRWLNPKRQRDRVRDELVRFPGMDEGEDFVILRLVQIRQADGAWWSYVTNLVDEELAPADIQGLYRARWRVEIFFRHLKHTLNMGHWFAESEAGVQAQLYAALIGYVLSQAVLLWASREARVAPEQFRFTTVVHELAEWLKAQLYLDQLLPREELLDRVRRNAAERDQRRNSECFTEFAA